MIERRSFLAGLLAAPIFATTNVAEIASAPMQVPEVIVPIQVPPYCVFRTADFPFSDRIAGRLRDQLKGMGWSDD